MAQIKIFTEKDWQALFDVIDPSIKKPKRLTLDEMYGLFKTDTYKDYHGLIQEDKEGNTKVEVMRTWHIKERPLLYRHIIAEQALGGVYVPIDDVCDLTDCNIYFSLLELWMNPLVWKNRDEYKELIIDGKVAAEQFEFERYFEIQQKIDAYDKYILSDFVEDPFINDEDDFEFGYVKGMRDWKPLTAGYSELRDKIRQGERVTHNEINNVKSYDIFSLRTNLTMIAEIYDGEKAIEILRLLQKEWPLIKLWKTEMSTMTPEDIEQFEKGLFHGFDDLLTEWTGEKPYDPNTLPPQKDYKALAEWLENEKEKGNNYYLEAGNNRSKMCRNLKKIVGWEVNENSLQKHQNKH